MLKRIWALIRKELQVQLHDKDSRRLLIVPVIMQLALFPFAATLEVKNSTLAIYNQDSGQNSFELMQRLSKTKAFPTLKILHNIHEVQETIDNQKALLVISIPSDFSRKIGANKTAALQTIIDGRRSNAGQIAAGYVQAIVDNYKTDLISHQILMKTIVVRNWFNPNLDYQWFILPSLIAIITTIGCLAVTAMSIAREREQGTFEQLLVSPLTTGYIMLGKTVPALLIASVQATIILLAAIWIYRIPFQGSVLLLYITLLCYGISLSGIGLLISSLSSTQQQAFLGIFAFMMPSVMLSGYVSPIENIPEPLRSLTWFNPIRHFIVISKGIYLKGFDFALVWHDLWPLIIIAFLTMSSAYVIFKKQAG
ncbi:MAG: ABC transporter permease [Gammaproteobacteria bacterium]|nr:ABC transporter permease [Gammaproteobacteria bacterium]